LAIALTKIALTTDSRQIKSNRVSLMACRLSGISSFNSGSIETETGIPPSGVFDEDVLFMVKQYAILTGGKYTVE
jgi:hypothetical protein